MSEDAETDEDDQAKLSAVATRVYEAGNTTQAIVRTRSAPLIAGADEYLKPVLASRPLGLLIALVVGATAAGGLFVFASETLVENTTATLLTLGLLVGILCAVALGAVSWGGSRRTSYW